MSEPSAPGAVADEPADEPRTHGQAGGLDRDGTAVGSDRAATAGDGRVALLLAERWDDLLDDERADLPLIPEPRDGADVDERAAARATRTGIRRDPAGGLVVSFSPRILNVVRLVRTTGPLALVAATLVACTTSSAPPPAPTARVERASVTTAVSSAGSLSAITEQNLGFNKAGQLKTVNVKVGQRVAAGDVLATLDDTFFRLTLDQQLGDLAAQRATLTRLINDTTVEGNRKTADQARDILSATQSQGSANVDSAQTAVDRAKKQLSFDEDARDDAKDAVDTANSACAAFQRSQAAAASSGATSATPPTTVTLPPTTVTVAPPPPTASGSGGTPATMAGSAGSGGSAQSEAEKQRQLQKQLEAVLRGAGPGNSGATGSSATGSSATGSSTGTGSSAGTGGTAGTGSAGTGSTGTGSTGTGTGTTGTGTGTGSTGTGTGTTGTGAGTGTGTGTTGAGAAAGTPVTVTTSTSPCDQAASAQNGLQQADAKVVSDRTTLDSAKQQQDVAQATGRLSEANAQQSVISAENSLTANRTDRPSLIAQQRGVVAAQEALVRSAQKDVDDTVLRAPAAATVSAVNGVAGEFLQAGSVTTPLAPGSEGAIPGVASGSTANTAAVPRPGGTQFVVLDNMDQFQVVVPFEESDALRISPDQKVNVSFDAIPDLTLPGTVTSVSPSSTALSSVISYYATVTLSQSDPRLKNGQTAQAAVLTNEVDDVLTVPNSAVRRQGDRATVTVQGFDGPRVVEFQPGAVGDERTQVLSGLTAGDEVVVPAGR